MNDIEIDKRNKIIQQETYQAEQSSKNTFVMRMLNAINKTWDRARIPRKDDSGDSFIRTYSIREISELKAAR